MTAKRPPRRGTLRSLVETEPRCIYCTGQPNSVEHMPPVWIFAGRQRPRGMEYATCKACNNGTRAADLTVGFLARIRPFDDPEGPLIQEAKAKIASIDQLAPGFREELFDRSPYQEGRIVQDGVVHDVVRIDANGPILSGLLTTFGAKLGMALYREHVGSALPASGGVFVQPFLNGGITQEAADKVLAILPSTSTLRMGQREVSDQFAYAFNTDDKSIVMALASFQRNLHFLVLATSEPEVYAATVREMFVTRVSPGQLLEDRSLQSLAPKKTRPFILPGLPGSREV